jgi:hypothetical protein
MDKEKGNFILLFIANNHVYNHTIKHHNNHVYKYTSKHYKATQYKR